MSKDNWFLGSILDYIWHITPNLLILGKAILKAEDCRVILMFLVKNQMLIRDIKPTKSVLDWCFPLFLTFKAIKNI